MDGAQDLGFEPEGSADATFSQLIVEHATDSMVFTDPGGLMLWANKPFFKMSGYELADVIGKKPGAVLQGPKTDGATVAEISAAIKSRRTIRTELLNYTKSGDPYWIDLTITPVFNKSGELSNFMSIERDITAAKNLIARTEEALAEERDRRRERKVLSQMSEWLFAAQSLSELQSVVTRSMSRLFPDTQGELYVYSNSRDVLDLVSSWGEPDCNAHLHADQCWGLRRGRPYAFGTSEIDFCCDHVGAEDHPYFCLPIIAHGDTIGLLHISFPDLLAARDKSEEMAKSLALSLEVAQICAEQISLAAANVRLQAELQDKSVKDALTGLWNRRWFLDMAGREIRRAVSAGSDLCLAMIDVDHFKKFNDAHGHDAGDAVLKVLAEHMAELQGSGIYPCRIGGEEFAILMSGHDTRSAHEVIEALRASLSKAKIIHSGSALPGVTISTGISRLGPNDTLEALMKNADQLLYAAKAAGRNCTMLERRKTGASKSAKK